MYEVGRQDKFVFWISTGTWRNISHEG